MNEKITLFLNSGLLEKYLIGETNSVETEKVESFISKYPDVQNTYNSLQHNLEIVSKANAAEAPKFILDNILEELDEKPVVNLNTKKKYKIWHKFSIAASIAALIFAGTSYFFYNQNIKLSEENQVVVDEIFDLRGEIE